MKKNPFKSRSLHSFHIPVMGTSFTIDTPLKVARYGISSVLSLVDDVLIEKMRRQHCQSAGEAYEEIKPGDEDSRARRITSYLDLLEGRIRNQMDQLKHSVFEQGSEITRYFEMLPPSPLKTIYQRMKDAPDPKLKERLQNYLREKVKTGSIDVNIMTKLDRDHFRGGVKMPQEFSDAMAALRGFAQSKLNVSLILSAGLNRRLYSYLSGFDDFYPDDRGDIKKRIVLKVSDFRSAVAQGRYLARLGLWVSEFRIESGLNCGGHAFATQGQLMGPILEEFRQKREELKDQLHEACTSGLEKLGRPAQLLNAEQRLTVQGGIGTHGEQSLLMDYFKVDGTGWGSPFLLVPEAVNLDSEHQEKLIHAEKGDVFLSDASPLGVPFWNLKTSASEQARMKRIAENRPGSSCPKGYLALGTDENGRSLCPASRSYQKDKLEKLSTENFTPEQESICRQSILAKACICHDLSGQLPVLEEEDPTATTAVCAGPNIVHFKRIFSLEEMVGHIYGGNKLLDEKNRPHMFIQELSLYIDYLRQDLQARKAGLDGKIRSVQEYRENLLSGMEYYRTLAADGMIEKRDSFLENLSALGEELQGLVPETAVQDKS